MQLHITDHFPLSFNVSLYLSTSKTPRVNFFRNIKNINKDSLSSYIAALTLDSSSSHDDLVSVYNSGLTSILDSLAPVKSRDAFFSRSAPWFASDLCAMK